MPNEWQQEFELNHAKTSDQSIRSVLAYFDIQQSFKDRNKNLPKNSFQTITQNRLRIAEGNRVMRQENEHVSRQFYNDKFTPSGRGRARTIVNAAGRAWDHQANVHHQALQAIHTYHDYRGPCLVHPEGTHTWGNCFRILVLKVVEQATWLVVIMDVAIPVSVDEDILVVVEVFHTVILWKASTILTLLTLCLFHMLVC